MNRELVGLLAHDLKNQLGMLEAELAALSLQVNDPRARAAHQHCAQLRQRLVAYLTLYGGARGGLSAQLVDESPTEFLHSLQHMASRPPQAPLALRAPPADLPPFWYFDARLLRLALEAALHNAWRFARQGVWLGVERHEGGLLFTVDDDGPGLGSQDPSAQSSTGLGMQLCAAVARAHRREALRGWVELGPRLGGGTRFALWLP
jgi:signal transduction histidine kinase